jgi:lipopolysaccharide export system permease protein
MKKLDWYILKQLLVSFIFCMLLFTVIAIAVDSSEKTDDFVKSGLSTTQIITQYYIGFVPYIWGLLYPLFVFIAVIFFTSKMALRSEIIAILASGTTYNRWLRTYIAGGLFFAVVLWFAARYGIPRGNAIRSTFQAAYIDKNSSQASSNFSFYRRVDTNTYMGLRYFDTASKTGNNFFLNRVSNGKLIFNLRADRIKWNPSKKDWKLSNVIQRKIDSSSENVQEVTELEMDLHIAPDAFRRDLYLKDNLTTPELVSYINAEELRGSEGINTLKVERYRRTATPASVLLLTIIGAIVAGRKTRGGSGFHLAIGIIIAAVFILFDRFSTVFSTKGDLHPLLAAWIPNIVFSFVAFYLFRKAPK